jgi:hypothetical protein
LPGDVRKTSPPAASLEAVKSRRRVVLVAPPAECAAWVAAITLAVPRSVAYELSFTTYIRDVSQLNYVISGVDGRDHSTWSGHQLQFDFYVFDIQRGIQSPVATTSAFARLAADAYRAHDLERLADFGNFCAGLHTPPSADTLDDLVLLYQLGTANDLGRAAVLEAASLGRTLMAESSAIVQPILQQLARFDAHDDQVNRAAWDLFRAARGSATSTAVDVLNWFIGWVAAQWLPGADAAGIDRMGQALQEQDLPAAQWQGLVRALTRELLNTEDSSRLIALLKMTNRLGVSSNLGEAQRDALETLVVHAAEDETIGHLFVDAIIRQDQDAGDVLFQALTGCMSEPQGFAAWRRVLANEAVRQEIERRCRRQQFLPLYLSLNITDPPPEGSRTTWLVRLLDQVLANYPGYRTPSTFGELVQLVEAIYVARIFPEPAIPVSEIHELVQLLHPEWIVSTSLHAKTIRGLMMQPQLIVFTGPHTEIIKGLMTKPQLDDESFRDLVDRVILHDDWRCRRKLQLAPDADVIPLLKKIYHDWCARLGGSSTRWLVPYTREFMRSIPSNYAEFRRQILMFSFHETLLDPIAVSTLRTLLEQLSPFDPEVWPVVTSLLQLYAMQQPPGEWFGTLFEILAPLQRQCDSLPAIEVLDEPLRVLWNSLPKDEKRLVERHLGASTTAGSQWQSWQRRRGWLANLRKGRLF